ncbi:hypothetical protein ACQP3C_29120, partial [Escherichia coli]
MVEALPQLLASIYPKSLECNGGSSTQAPIPYLPPNPAAFQKAHQMMSPSPEMLKTTSIGYVHSLP